MEKIIKELGTSFSLSPKEQLILNMMVSEKPGQKLNAEEISRNTKIPLGRIYNYLNSLIDKKLIEKSEKKPHNYFIDKIEENVVEFLKRNFEDTVTKQNRIMYLLEHRTGRIEEIDTINSGEDFSFRTIQMIKEGRYIRNIVRHGSVPFALYPKGAENFLKIRKIVTENRATLSNTTPEMTFMLYSAHEEAYKKGEIMEYIMEKSAMDFHFNIIRKVKEKKFFNKMIDDIKERLGKYNVKIFILNEPIPMQIMVSSKRVFLSIIHQRHTQGLIVTNPSAVELYSNYFEEMKKRSKPIQNYLKKL